MNKLYTLLHSIVNTLNRVERDKVDTSQLNTEVNNALNTAKESGQFDGAAGKNGVSVTKTEINSRGELVITLSDSSVSNLGVVVGAKGETGAQGDKGDKGDTGATGQQGIQGVQGDKGDKGDTGASGKDGVSVTHEWDGTTLKVTSASGTTSANLKGEPGNSGVHFGSDEPKDDSSKVWVDLSSQGDVLDYIPSPDTATVGQTIVVKTVDENGKPTEWEAADLPSGGRWKLLADLTTTEDVTNLRITADMDGNSILEQNFSEIYMHYFLNAKDGYASRYSALSVWFHGGFGGGEDSTYASSANGYDNMRGSVYGICPQQHHDTTYGRRVGISFCTNSQEVKKFMLGATDKMAISLRSEAGIVAGSRFIVYGR